MIEIIHLNNTNSSFRFFSSLFLINFLCSSIRLTLLILLQRRFFGPRYIGDDFFFRAEIYRGLFFRADRSLGAKQEDPTIVHFLNKLIISCKEAVQFPFLFFWGYFLFKLKGYFLYFTPIVHSMPKLRKNPFPVDIDHILIHLLTHMLLFSSNLAMLTITLACNICNWNDFHKNHIYLYCPFHSLYSLYNMD